MNIKGRRYVFVCALWPWMGLNAQTVDLSADLSTAADTPEASVAAEIGSICSRLSALPSRSDDQNQLLSACTELGDASNDFDERVSGLVAISAKASTAQMTTSTRTALGDNTNFIGQRLNALRKGLAFQDVATVNLYYNDMQFADVNLHRVNGGGAGSDEGDSGFSGYLNGDYSIAEQTANDYLAGYESDAFSLTAGGDTRIANQGVVGVALHYLSNSLDLSHGQGELEGSGLGLIVYGSYFPADDWFFEASLHSGSSSYDMSRRVDFTINNIAFNETAKSSTDAKQSGFSFGGGKDITLNNGALLAFSGQLNYLISDIDAYAESGGGGFDLNIESQEIKQTLVGLSVQLTKAMSTASGVFIPSIRLSLIKDFSADEQDVTASFVSDPDNAPFSFSTPTRDSSYAELAVGSSFYLVSGAAIFAQLETLQLLDDYDQLTFSFRHRS